MNKQKLKENILNEIDNIFANEWHADVAYIHSRIRSAVETIINESDDDE